MPQTCQFRAANAQLGNGCTDSVQLCGFIYDLYAFYSESKDECKTAK